MNVELEHGLHDARTNVSDDDPHVTAKIAFAHLNEFPDYYTAWNEWKKRQNTAGPTEPVTRPPRKHELPTTARSTRGPFASRHPVAVEQAHASG